MLQMAKDDVLEAGAVVANRYELERVVGEGGMGVVWAARDRKSGNLVALKFLREERAADLRHQTRLVREAKAAATVRHPNVATVHEVLETEGGRPFLVMDLLEGEPLSARLARDGTLPVAECAYLLGAVVDAIQAAHGSGIVHRDLKPENIFLLAAGRGPAEVRVLDFGIAKTVEREDTTNAPSLTTTGTMLGTPYYMAPEQIFGDSDVDGRADIWALGVVLYECLSGKRPTQATGVGQVLKVIMNDAIPPLAEVAPDVPVELTDLVSRMLSRRREDRPELSLVRTVLAEAASLPSRPSIPSPSRRLSRPTLDSMAVGEGAPSQRGASTPSARLATEPTVASARAVASEPGVVSRTGRARVVASAAVLLLGGFGVVVASSAGTGGGVLGSGNRAGYEAARSLRAVTSVPPTSSPAGMGSAVTTAPTPALPLGRPSLALASTGSKAGPRPSTVATVAPSGTIPSGERR